jgi:pimeloyl-ACP methyl ester carboxylesterase
MWKKVSVLLSHWRTGIRLPPSIRKFLSIFLLVLLSVFLLHLGWRKWLLSVPQRLPQTSMLAFGRKDSLQRGSYYEVSIPPTGSAQYISADYRIWIPNGISKIRGLIVKQHGCGGNAATPLGLVHANDLQWQALALKHQFALLGTKYPTDYQTKGRYADDPCNSWAAIARGSETAFLKALNQLGQDSRHPELEKLPWVLWGHSGGADWVVQMSQKYPNRTIAVVAMRGGAVLIDESKPSELLTSEINAATLKVPVLFATGEKEPSAEEGLHIPKKIFARYRKAGALWAFAAEAEAGHEAADTRHLVIPYIDAIVSTRLPSDRLKDWTTSMPTLRPIEAEQGWLGNLTTHAIASSSQYNGDPSKAVWLPNQETAHRWQQYQIAPNFWNHLRFKLCSNWQLMTLLGARDLPESCYPDKIALTQAPAAPSDLQVTKISGTEVILTWNFIPDLENGLPKFRIYRNNSLIATLQGQEYDAGDAPKPAQVVLEYRDREWTANSVYAIAAFNALGERISQPAS